MHCRICGRVNPRVLRPSGHRGSARGARITTRFRPRKHPRLRSAPLHFGAVPCCGGADSGTRAKTPGPVVSPPAVRLRGPHLAASAPAPGQAALLPSRRLRAGRLAARLGADSELPEIGTPAEASDAPNASRTSPVLTADTASHCIKLVARSSLDALACLLRAPRRHTREDSGAFLASLHRPPARTSFVGTAPATGSLGSERPETSRRPNPKCPCLR